MHQKRVLRREAKSSLKNLYKIEPFSVYHYEAGSFREPAFF